MNRNLAVTALSALFVITAFTLVHAARSLRAQGGEALQVGFIYDGDESVPYTANFMRAQHAVEAQFGSRAAIHVRSNVPSSRIEESLQELADDVCRIIFTTSFGFGEGTKRFAALHPHIQFCQATCDNAANPPLANYHTFMGEIYQGRYVAGIAAGMKLRELVQKGAISADAAVIGYVGAFPYAEVISGYTAFLLGARSVLPTATMRVRYTNTWGSYSIEKAFAQTLIDEGCVIIAQHSDTIGPAVACEEQFAKKTVFHVGYNQSMIDVAPMTSLVSTRINWVPYVTGAVQAVLDGRAIEKTVRGNVHGNDIGAGFERDWVQLLELNTTIAAAGTAERLGTAVQAFKKSRVPVFVGDYRGVNPADSTDTCDLRTEYKENADASAPSFHYLLQDVITIEE